MTSKVKKIISIVIISLILAITVAVVVLALIPKKLYNPVPTDYTTLTVYRNKKSQTYLIDDGHPEHKEINAELLYCLSGDIEQERTVCNRYDRTVN